MLAAQPLAGVPGKLLDEQGQPQCGKFAGKMESLDWRGLAAPHKRGALWRYFHHKRWQYVALATDDLFCGIAIVDLGWINTAFAYAFDRRQGREVGSFSQDGIPGLTASIGMRPAAGADSSFSFLGKRISYRHDATANCYQLRLRDGQFEIDADIDANAAAPFLLAIGPVRGGTVHATQKSSGMAVRGEVRASGKQYALDAGIASVDYSSGFLGRETSWCWASAHGRDVGFNLQAGYFGEQENALWLDGELFGLGAAQFDFDPAHPMSPWHITTSDGLLDLQFQPEGLRREDKNLLVAASRYVQPIGMFSGWVKSGPDASPRAVHKLAGVTEDHFSRW
ncbi:DUF2804 domain-containing protein [Undibacterium sp. TJN25]|uniref:DUF2804 domain-containing protein n=1 Tax=Undibacterium sp. TJN25 TaxID=3413056 RepID=UPI003BF281C6